MPQFSRCDRLTVRLTDNGRGFERTLSYPGFGLQGMKERIQLLDGELEFRSALGAGTQIQVMVPLGQTSRNRHKLRGEESFHTRILSQLELRDRISAVLWAKEHL